LLFRKKYNKLSFFVYNLDHSFTKPTRMPNSFVHVTDTAIHESNIATHIPIKYLYIITNVYYNLATKNSKYWAYATSNDQPIYIPKKYHNQKQLAKCVPNTVSCPSNMPKLQLPIRTNYHQPIQIQKMCHDQSNVPSVYQTFLVETSNSLNKEFVIVSLVSWLWSIKLQTLILILKLENFAKRNSKPLFQKMWSPKNIRSGSLQS